jgi:hypothetical protein
MMLRLGNKPKIPQGLAGHNCINLRLRTHGGLYARKFGEERRELLVRIEGQVTFNGSRPLLDAALAGFGLA